MPDPRPRSPDRRAGERLHLRLVWSAAENQSDNMRFLYGILLSPMLYKETKRATIKPSNFESHSNSLPILFIIG